MFENSNLTNIGAIYSNGVTGAPGTTEVVLSGGIRIPKGKYVVVLNIGTGEPSKFQQIGIRIGNDKTLVSASKGSTHLTTILDVSSDTDIFAYAQTTEVNGINITADPRFNYLIAIKVK